MCIKSKWKCAAHGPPSPSSLQRVVLLVVPWSAEPHVLSVWIRWKKQLLSADQPSVSHQPRPPLLLLLHRPLYCNGTFTWFSHTLKPSWHHRWLCYSRLHMICQPVSHIQSFFLRQVIFWIKLFQNHKSSREKVFSVVLHFPIFTYFVNMQLHCETVCNLFILMLSDWPAVKEPYLLLITHRHFSMASSLTQASLCLSTNACWTRS